MGHKSDQERIEQTRNVPRFFVEHPQVSWVLLLGVLIWGWFGYHSMPQRKDPNIPVRVAVASCSWPGATAQQVEQLITRPIEDTVAQNKTIHAGTPADYGVRSISLPGYSYVYIQLIDDVDDLKRQFSDINLKLNALSGQLPQGAGPITFQSDFGDTAALMLTVASPKAVSVEIDLRSQSIQAAVRSARATKRTVQPKKPVTVIYPFPESVSPRSIASAAALFERQAIKAGILSDTTQIQGTGFIGLDGASVRDDASIQAFIQQFFATQLQRS
jgi:multidrug efflux pump